MNTIFATFANFARKIFSSDSKKTVL
jgi:hypothetical protein